MYKKKGIKVKIRRPVNLFGMLCILTFLACKVKQDPKVIASESLAYFNISEPWNKDLLPYAESSMHHFMVLNPEPFCDHPGMYLLRFDCYGLPPSLDYNQWGWGDGTGRAVEAWIDLRTMTNDREFGRSTEKGQRELLLWLLTPGSGMAYVPELSDPETGSYYYHMWDQGRVLRALVRWWNITNDTTEKQFLSQKIHQMTQSLKGLSSNQVDSKWGMVSEFPYSVFDKGKPGKSFTTMSGGQLIEPLTTYWELSGDSASKEFADALCNGILAASEFNPEKPDEERFGTDGSFTGHFHNKASIVSGIAKRAVALIKNGEKDKGLSLLRWAKKVYDWTLSPSNINCGSTWGWFPESMGNGTKSRTIMEICCTADMIELAVVLAKASDVDPSLYEYDKLWDHVERYTINTILSSQFRITPAYAGLVSNLNGDLALAERLVGGWVGYHPPNDLVTYEHDDGKPEMLMGSCCNYSGTRGLFACWKNIFDDHHDTLTVRLPVTRKSQVASQTVIEGPTEVDQVLQVDANRTVRIRIPDWAKMDQVTVSYNSGTESAFSVEGRYISLGELTKGSKTTIKYPLSERQTTERIGGAGNSTHYTSPNQKTAYTVRWKGNRITGMQPTGNLLPIFPTN